MQTLVIVIGEYHFDSSTATFLLYKFVVTFVFVVSFVTIFCGSQSARRRHDEHNVGS